MEDQLTKIDEFIDTFNKKQKTYTELVESLNYVLDNFQSNANGAYKNVAEHVDKMKKEISERITLVSSKLSQLHVVNEKGINEDTQLGALVIETKNSLEEISNYFINVQKNDEKIFNEIKFHISKVDEVKNSIQSVEELSTDIEILAFNAMIVAAKAGVEGLAFSCITDELKSISNQTLLIVNDLMHQEKDLFNHYNRFQSSISDIEQLQKETNSLLSNDMNQEFDKLLDGVVSIGTVSSGITKEFDQIIPLFNEVLDILEQKKSIPTSIDIIKNALKQIEKNKEELHIQDEYEPSCILQLLVGQTKISKISTRLFEDICSYIDLTADLLNSKYSNLNEKINSVSKSNNALINYFVNQNGEFSYSAISLLFSDCGSSIQNVVDLIKKTIESKQKISETGRALIGHIESLEEQFQFLTKTAKKFNLINISSKIEIAKRKVLSNHGNISEKIEEITEEIGNTLFKTYDQLVMIKKSSEQSLSQFDINLVNQAERSQNFISLIQKVSNKYEASENGIKDVVSSFILVTDKFKESMNLTGKDVDEISKLKKYPENAVKIFREINSLIASSKTYLLELSNSSEEEIPVPYYNEIFENIEKVEHRYKEFKNIYANQ
jgi:hypothetical protein